MLTQEELSFFKTKLEERRDKLKRNLNIAQDEITGMMQNELKDEGDLASMYFDSSVDNAIFERQLLELAEIEVSLGKISNNLYGICEMCEADIGIPRLKVKMFARYCIVCRDIVEKEHR
ncbi:MAG: molecular chaperone DnaK [Sulfurovum sp. AS07-7]|jgi:DnaK suppressor protein|nr:MAG: molecular chaperone DnaK [Sulfurovum sp. AS07-7]MBD3794827.1 RNA polymerase-binding protein DksA [Campylobacterota bacterium]MBD3840075.1 RNA polymerase-binding protein DksA [Campylobacterota bacterium]TQV61979.1 MAG: RNA polymerase-binding protein DksA [Sulfurovum sp.]